MAISKLLSRILVFRCFFFLLFFSFYLLHDLAASLKMLFNSPFFYQYDNESCTSFTTLSHQRMKTKNNLRRIRVYTEVLACNIQCRCLIHLCISCGNCTKLPWCHVNFRLLFLRFLTDTFYRMFDNKSFSKNYFFCK